MTSRVVHGQLTIIGRQKSLYRRWLFLHGEEVKLINLAEGLAYHWKQLLFLLRRKRRYGSMVSTLHLDAR